uniref:Uncharacterized protein n=1 Tax=Solanum tuberosum TaxID=4113 RepID=M1D9P9_SOLTU
MTQKRSLRLLNWTTKAAHIPLKRLGPVGFSAKEAPWPIKQPHLKRGNDQVGGKREQSAHRRDVPRDSTMSPNDPQHDDAEGWCKMAMNYIKG